jgi:MSHA pilin protein MshA
MKSITGQKGQQGFTLIELIVVIVILGILAATALPLFVNLGADARLAVMKGAEGSMRAANAQIYAAAAVNNTTNCVNCATPVQGVVGGTVQTTYGYATNMTNLALAMDLSPAGDFTIAAFTLSHARAITPATCRITYAAATNAAGVITPPTYTETPAPLTAAGCS